MAKKTSKIENKTQPSLCLQTWLQQNLRISTTTSTEYTVYGRFLQPDVLKTWRFVNLTFCKPDVLQTWRFVNLTYQTFWNRTFRNLTFWNLTFWNLTFRNLTFWNLTFCGCTYGTASANARMATVTITIRHITLSYFSTFSLRQVEFCQHLLSCRERGGESILTRGNSRDEESICWHMVPFLR